MTYKNTPPLAQMSLFKKDYVTMADANVMLKNFHKCIAYSIIERQIQTDKEYCFCATAIEKNGDTYCWNCTMHHVYEAEQPKRTSPKKGYVLTNVVKEWMKNERIWFRKELDGTYGAYIHYLADYRPNIFVSEQILQFNFQCGKVL